MDGPSGILPIDKPVGMTSHDVVDVIREYYGIRRVGHTGTLDPAASGLLLIVMGKATRVASYLSAQEKTYLAGVVFGSTSDSGDIDGTITPTGRPIPDGEILKRIVAEFVGEIELPVPALASVRTEGRRRYELARRGHDVPEMRRRSVIHSIEVIGTELRTDEAGVDSRRRGNDGKDSSSPRLMPSEVVAGRGPMLLRVRCSSGTYIRALAQAMGEKAGCGAYLGGLRREAVGNARVEGAYGLDYLAMRYAHDEPLPDPEAIDDYLTLPVIEIDPEAESVIHHGQRLTTLMLTAVRGEFGVGENIAIAIKGYGVAAIGKALLPSADLGREDLDQNAPIVAYQCVLI